MIGTTEWAKALGRLRRVSPARGGPAIVATVNVSPTMSTAASNAMVLRRVARDACSWVSLSQKLAVRKLS